MPNHVENDLYLFGEHADINEILDCVGMNDTPPKFEAEAITPYPDPFRQMDEDARALAWNSDASPEVADAARSAYVAKWGTDKDGFNSGGYEWRLNNWGTKFGCYDVVRRDYGGVCITFQTEWNPPTPLLIALSRKFPKVTLRLEYFEMGMSFAGGFTLLGEQDAIEYEQPQFAPIAEWRTDQYRGFRGG